jgi:hypothetical protein
MAVIIAIQWCGSPPPKADPDPWIPKKLIRIQGSILNGSGSRAKFQMDLDPSKNGLTPDADP